MLHIFKKTVPSTPLDIREYVRSGGALIKSILDGAEDVLRIHNNQLTSNMQLWDDLMSAYSPSVPSEIPTIQQLERVIDACGSCPRSTVVLALSRVYKLDVCVLSRVHTYGDLYWVYKNTLDKLFTGDFDTHRVLMIIDTNPSYKRVFSEIGVAPVDTTVDDIDFRDKVYRKLSKVFAKYTSKRKLLEPLTSSTENVLTLVSTTYVTPKTTCVWDPLESTITIKFQSTHFTRITSITLGYDLKVSFTDSAKYRHRYCIFEVPRDIAGRTLSVMRGHDGSTASQRYIIEIGDFSTGSGPQVLKL